jgi:opacity protein-like surface antigen
MVSFPASIFLVCPFSRVSVFFGLGFSYHSYEEKWAGMALSHKGNKTSMIAFSGAEVRLSSRISARLALRYESIEVEPSSSLFDRVNLGGVSLLGGFSFRLL